MSREARYGEAVNLARNWLDKQAGGWEMHVDGTRLLAEAVMALSESAPITLVDDVRMEGLIAYINALFVSGNEVPVTTTLFGVESWEVIKECLRDGLPLDYNIVESECVYRRKLAAYGDETRATSPLKKLRDRVVP